MRQHAEERQAAAEQEEDGDDRGDNMGDLGVEVDAFTDLEELLPDEVRGDHQSKPTLESQS